jgi:hypothetical protein
MTKSKPTRRWPSTACASLERQAPTSDRRRAVVDTGGDHPDPGHPSRVAACPLPRCTTSSRSDTADAGRHGHRTPHRTPEAGHWTPGRSDTRTGHRTPITWTGTRGTMDARTGHRRGQGDDITAGVRTSWGLLAERPHAGTPNRVPALALSGSCWVAPLARPRLGALLSSEMFEWRVERDDVCHPVHGREPGQVLVGLEAYVLCGLQPRGAAEGLQGIDGGTGSGCAVVLGFPPAGSSRVMSVQAFPDS